jgi:serine/threonine-protein kinase
MRRAACRRLAAIGTAQAVPFLVSALANGDEEIRRIAAEGLRCLKEQDAIEALSIGYMFAKDEALGEILTELGRQLPGSARLQPPEPSESGASPSAANEAWSYRNARDGTILAFIPEGDFLAGEQRFRVHLPAYYLAYSCVTNAQFARFLTERRPSPGKLTHWCRLDPNLGIRKEGDKFIADPAGADHPVVWVTWEGAAAYCKWAGLRLPSELEWEKGARGVDGRPYPWGDEWEAGRPDPPEGEEGGEEITSVWAYSSARSPYGLCQMIGGVYQWCADCYEESAYERYAKGDLSAPRGQNRVLRGGPWRFGTPAHLRTEYRKSTVWPVRGQGPPEGSEQSQRWVADRLQRQSGAKSGKESERWPRRWQHSATWTWCCGFVI